jgi:hypothetical protein
METAVGSVLSTVPSSVFVVDCGANMSPALIAENAVPFVQVGNKSPTPGVLLCGHKADALLPRPVVHC